MYTHTTHTQTHIHTHTHAQRFCCYCSSITLEQFIVAAIMKRLQLVQPYVHRWHEVNKSLDVHYLACVEDYM